VRQSFEDLRRGGWKNATSADTTIIARPGLNGGPDIRLSHVHRGAQGNVGVAAQLAKTFANPTDQPDYVVFYGCAGAIKPANVGRVYLVAETRYLSLGTVAVGPSGECVTLKNKWIEYAVHPRKVDPIAPGVFPLVGGNATRNLLNETTLPPARVLATDAVVHVAPDEAPPAENVPGQPGKWAEAEWTYGQAMAHVIDQSAGMDTLVEMESYGIAATTRALGLGERVVVMRITTDALADKNSTSSGQKQLLLQGRLALLQLLAVLLELT
jgi:hypothetical protein